MLGDLLLELEEFSFRDPNLDDDVDIKSEFVVVDACRVSGDDAVFLEFLDAVHDGNEAELDFCGKFAQGLFWVQDELVEDSQVMFVDDGFLFCGFTCVHSSHRCSMVFVHYYIFRLIDIILFIFFCISVIFDILLTVLEVSLWVK